MAEPTTDPRTDQGQWLLAHQGLINIGRVDGSMRGDEIDLRQSILTIEAEAAAPRAATEPGSRVAALEAALEDARAAGDTHRLRARRTAISGEDLRFTNGFDAALKFFLLAGDKAEAPPTAAGETHD